VAHLAAARSRSAVPPPSPSPAAARARPTRTRHHGGRSRSPNPSGPSGFRGRSPRDSPDFSRGFVEGTRGVLAVSWGDELVVRGERERESGQPAVDEVGA